MTSSHSAQFQLEVCIDHIESLHHAIAGGATRIELCSSLALGGLTPSPGVMQQAGRLSSVPVYSMIRPRQGDFVFNQDDLACMLADIDAAAHYQLQGVVIGALTAQAKLDLAKVTQLVERAHAHHLGVTFHRAIDQCHDYSTALEQLIELGCERVLTSGLAANAPAGSSVLKKMVQQVGDRLSIMAGAGVNADNVLQLIKETGVTEVHLSGKSTRNSPMPRPEGSVTMGNPLFDDFVIPVTDPQQIQAVAACLTQF